MVHVVSGAATGTNGNGGSGFFGLPCPCSGLNVLVLPAHRVNLRITCLVVTGRVEQSMSYFNTGDDARG